MVNAQCPIPNAQCPIPNAQCPLRILPPRVDAQAASQREASYVLSTEGNSARERTHNAQLIDH
jgi:hypothetical protein